MSSESRKGVQRASTIFSKLAQLLSGHQLHAATALAAASGNIPPCHSNRSGICLFTCMLLYPSQLHIPETTGQCHDMSGCFSGSKAFTHDFSVGCQADGLAQLFCMSKSMQGQGRSSHSFIASICPFKKCGAEAIGLAAISDDKACF